MAPSLTRTSTEQELQRVGKFLTSTNDHVSRRSLYTISTKHQMMLPFVYNRSVTSRSGSSHLHPNEPRLFIHQVNAVKRMSKNIASLPSPVPNEITSIKKKMMWLEMYMNSSHCLIRALCIFLQFMMTSGYIKQATDSTVVLEQPVFKLLIHAAMKVAQVMGVLVRISSQNESKHMFGSFSKTLPYHFLIYLSRPKQQP